MTDDCPIPLPTDYEWMRRWVKGGEGVVVWVRKKSTGEHRVIKRYYHFYGDSLDRFKRSVSIQNEVAGYTEFVLPILASDEDPPHGPYVVMTAATDGSLADAISNAGPAGLEPYDSLVYLAQLSVALDVTHRLGKVHKDVKCGNALLHLGKLRLSDFGIARDVLDARYTARADRATMEHTAPEVLNDPRRILPPSDIYSLGSIGFELLCRRIPFHAFVAEGWLAYLNAVDKKEPPRPSSLNHFLGRYSDRAFSTALAKEPARRPSSARRAVALIGAGLVCDGVLSPEQVLLALSEAPLPWSLFKDAPMDELLLGEAIERLSSPRIKRRPVVRRQAAGSSSEKRVASLPVAREKHPAGDKNDDKPTVEAPRQEVSHAQSNRRSLGHLLRLAATGAVATAGMLGFGLPYLTAELGHHRLANGRKAVSNPDAPSGITTLPSTNTSPSTSGTASNEVALKPRKAGPSPEAQRTYERLVRFAETRGKYSGVPNESDVTHCEPRYQLTGAQTAEAVCRILGATAVYVEYSSVRAAHRNYYGAVRSGRRLSGSTSFTLYGQTQWCPFDWSGWRRTDVQGAFEQGSMAWRVRGGQVVHIRDYRHWPVVVVVRAHSASRVCGAQGFSA